MMTAKELMEILKDVPENIPVFIYADHGQQCESLHGIGYTDEEIPDYPYLEDLEWVEDKSTDTTAVMLFS